MNVNLAVAVAVAYGSQSQGGSVGHSHDHGTGAVWVQIAPAQKKIVVEDLPPTTGALRAPRATALASTTCCGGKHQ